MSRKKFNIFQDIYEIVLLIPKGRVTTYGAIANTLGGKSSARIVGWALNQSFAKQGIPAHRVVNRNGFLTGKYHFATPTYMQELLQEEGIKVKNDQILSFKERFWDPQDIVQ